MSPEDFNNKMKRLLAESGRETCMEYAYRLMLSVLRDMPEYKVGVEFAELVIQYR